MPLTFQIYNLNFRNILNEIGAYFFLQDMVKEVELRDFVRSTYEEAHRYVKDSSNINYC